MRNILLILFIVISFVSNINCYGQRNINISSEVVELSANEEIMFYDDGGESDNYNNFADYVQTFTAPDGYKLYIIFESYETESNSAEQDKDYLRAYDGADTTNFPLLIYKGQTGWLSSDLRLNVYYRTNNNSLTIRWKSNEEITAAGWKARIGCSQQNEITCSVKEYGVLMSTSSNDFNSIVYSSNKPEYKRKFGKISYFFTPVATGSYKITGKEGNGYLDQGDPEFIVVYNETNYFLNGDGGTAIFNFDFIAGTTYEIFITSHFENRAAQYNIIVEPNFVAETNFELGTITHVYNCTNHSENVIANFQSATNNVGTPILYSSSNPNIATVNATTGEVTALRPGMVTIIANSDGIDCFDASSANYIIEVQTEAAPIVDTDTKYSCEGTPVVLNVATNGDANTFWLSTSKIKEIICNSTDIFRNEHAVTIEPENESGRTYLKLTMTDENPFVWFSNFESLDATNNQFIHFTYKIVGWNGASPNTYCQLYWTDGEDGANESRRSNIPIIADGEWHTQIINVNEGELGGEQWQGTINSLRFDPCEDELANFQNAYMLLDHITFRDVILGTTAEIPGSKIPISYMAFNKCTSDYDFFWWQRKCYKYYQSQ